MHDLTIVYYTHNRERPEFEAEIRKTLRENSRGIPIICVSQKPETFGDVNICVGEVGACARNAWRQYSIGCREAKTRFVCPAESDMIYPPEFYEFVPPRDDVFYIAHPVYVCFSQRGYSKKYGFKRRGTEAAMISSREYAIARVENMLSGGPMWRSDLETATEMDNFPYLYNRRSGTNVESFYLKTPIISFKTDGNMHKKTPHVLDENCRFIEAYGDPRDLIMQYKAHSPRRRRRRRPA